MLEVPLQLYLRSQSRNLLHDMFTLKSEVLRRFLHKEKTAPEQNLCETV